MTEMSHFVLPSSPSPLSPPLSLCLRLSASVFPSPPRSPRPPQSPVSVPDSRFMLSASDTPCFLKSTRRIPVRGPFREPPSNIKSRFYDFVFGSCDGSIFVSWRSFPQFWLSKVSCHHLEPPRFRIYLVFPIPPLRLSRRFSRQHLHVYCLLCFGITSTLDLCFFVFGFQLLCFRLVWKGLLSLEVQRLDITISEL
jgi:hypothetical protein